MHGLIFETSVWLLAGSTRLLSCSSTTQRKRRIGPVKSGSFISTTTTANTIVFRLKKTSTDAPTNVVNQKKPSCTFSSHSTTNFSCFTHQRVCEQSNFVAGPKCVCYCKQSSQPSGDPRGLVNRYRYAKRTNTSLPFACATCTHTGQMPKWYPHFCVTTAYAAFRHNYVNNVIRSTVLGLGKYMCKKHNNQHLSLFGARCKTTPTILSDTGVGGAVRKWP